jgi:hypothetical protein
MRHRFICTHYVEGSVANPFDHSPGCGLLLFFGIVSGTCATMMLNPAAALSSLHSHRERQNNFNISKVVLFNLQFLIALTSLKLRPSHLCTPHSLPHCPA